MKKILVVYYSLSGITKRLAEDIALLMEADLRELLPEKPYSFNYNTAVKEIREQIDRGFTPKLMEGDEDVEKYDLIFIGSPNWLKTYAPPVQTFLKNVNLKGKTLVPFCTHGGGGLGNIEKNIRMECKESIVKEGLALGASYNLNEVEEWLRDNYG